MAKNGAKYFVGSNGSTGNLRKMVKTFTKIFGEKIAAKIEMDTFNNPIDAFLCMSKSVVMTNIGDNNIIFSYFRNIGGLVNSAF